MLESRKLLEADAAEADDDVGESTVRALRAELPDPDEQTDEDVDKDAEVSEGEPDEETDPDDSSDTEDDPASDGGVAVAAESMRRVRLTRLANEDFSETVGNLGRKSLSALGAGLGYLAHLGITYGPTVLRHAYKGVVFAATRLAKMMYLGFTALSRHLERQAMSLNTLEKDIQSYRRAIQMLQESDRIIQPGEFSDERLVTSLSINGKLDWMDGLAVTHQVLQSVMVATSKSVIAEIASLKRQMQEYNPKTYSPDSESLMIRPPRGMTERHSVTVGDAEYESYRYPQVLPGDRVIEWRMPVVRDSATDVQRITLGVIVRTDGQSNENPEYMSLDGLSKYLDQIEQLCSLMREQQKLYTLIKERKSALRGGLRLYLNQVFMSDTPIHVGSSMLDVTYMRAVLIDRVYLLGMMDLQDSISRIMRDSLYVVKRHVEHHGSASESS